MKGNIFWSNIKRAEIKYFRELIKLTFDVLRGNTLVKYTKDMCKNKKIYESIKVNIMFFRAKGGNLHISVNL